MTCKDREEMEASRQAETMDTESSRGASVDYQFKFFSKQLLRRAFVAAAVTPSTPAPKPRPALSFKSQTLPFIVNQAKARTSVWLSEREPAVLKSTLRRNGGVRGQNRAVGPADAKSNTRNIEV